MRELIDQEVNVMLKSGTHIFGIFSGVTDESIYVWAGDREYIVPKDNIEYFYLEKPKEKEEVEDRTLSVSINHEHIAALNIPEEIDYQKWSNELYAHIVSNQTIRDLLAGRVQKSIEFRQGSVNIMVEEIVPPSQVPKSDNTFAMQLGGGGPATQFLDPSQMVSRLNSVGSRKKDGET